METANYKKYLAQAKNVHYNNSASELIQHASELNEGILTVDGSFSVNTGKHTGRSPKDKHIIADKDTENNVWWGNNARIERNNFHRLENDMLSHMQEKELFVQDLHCLLYTSPSPRD